MGLLGCLFGGDKRNERLAAWGKTIHVSEKQRVAMQKIWQAVQSKTAPVGKPLTNLEPDELAYIFKICGSDFRPAEFGNADAMRLSTWRFFKDLGFGEDEAAVAVGMMFNFVGRDDI